MKISSFSILLWESNSEKRIIIWFSLSEILFNSGRKAEKSCSSVSRTSEGPESSKKPKQGKRMKECVRKTAANSMEGKLSKRWVLEPTKIFMSQQKRSVQSELTQILITFWFNFQIFKFLFLQKKFFARPYLPKNRKKKFKKSTLFESWGGSLNFSLFAKYSTWQ